MTSGPLPHGRVTFTLTHADIYQGVVVPTFVEVRLDANGQGVAQLWPNGDGTQGTQYRAIIRAANGSVGFNGLFTMPASNCSLHDVLDLVAPPSVDDATAAKLAAQAAAAAASTSQTAAAGSASAAAGSATGAAGSATSASDSAIAAAGSASSAAGSATAASASAGNASASAAAFQATVAGASAYSFGAGVLVVRLAGYGNAGDSGAATYKRVAAQPSHSGRFRSSDRYLPNGATSSSDGGWWEIAELELRPEMFGAKGDGSADDRVALDALCGAANALNRTIRGTRGRTYYVNSGNTGTSLRVSADWDGAVFKLGTGLSNEVFSLDGNALVDITSSVTSAEIVPFATNITSLAPYVNGFIKILSSTPNLKRFVGDAVALTKSECNYVTKGGVLSKPIRHDYTGGAITAVYFRQDDSTPLFFRGGGVDIAGKASPRFVICKRNSVQIDSWSVSDSAHLTKVDTALLFRIFECANTLVSKFYGDSMNQAAAAPAPSFSYLFDVSHAFNIRFDHIFAQAGWGAFKAESVNGYHISRSVIDRFDVHYDGYDISTDQCELYTAVQFGCGGGYLRVTNSEKIVKRVTPFMSDTTFFPKIVTGRGDYADSWNGDILIDNVRVHVCDGFSGQLAGVAFAASGDFGAARPLPWAQSIRVSNVKLVASDAVLADAATTFDPVSMTNGLTYTGGTAGTLLPHRVEIENVSWNKPNTAALVRDYAEISPTFAAAASDVSVLAFRPVSGGDQRGKYAVDLQIKRTSTFQVAGGQYSGVLSGFSNRAPGDFSAVLSGSSNIAGTANGVNPNAVVAGGVSNSATGTNATVSGGSTNAASSLNATIAGGGNNIATGSYAWVPGGRFGNTRSRQYSWAWGPNSGTSGRYQAAGISQAATTTDATPTVLTSDLLSVVSGANQFSLASNSCATFDVLLTARNTSASVSKAWRLTGLIKNNAGTTSLVGTVTKTVIGADASASAWDASATADVTNNALQLTVTGAAGSTIRWHARVEASEVA